MIRVCLLVQDIKGNCSVRVGWDIEWLRAGDTDLGSNPVLGHLLVARRSSCAGCEFLDKLPNFTGPQFLHRKWI